MTTFIPFIYEPAQKKEVTEPLYLEIPPAYEILPNPDEEEEPKHNTLIIEII